MTCRRAHHLLAAYRRDDWSPRDRAALGQHLSTCAACRHREVSYRGVGESVRQLPSITPPAGFREAVFAAIRADELRMGRAVASLTEADTSPELPVISLATPRRPTNLPAIRPIRPIRQRRAAWLNPQVALVAAAAVVMLGLLATQLLPHSGLATLAASLTGAHANNKPVARPAVSHYMPDAHARDVTRALATSGWLVYSASDSSGATTIYVENRQSKAVTPLAYGPATAPVVLRAVSGDWAFWSEGSASSWALYARPIRGGVVVVLLKSGAAASAPAALNGVWANARFALAAVTTQAGTSQVLQFALNTTATTAAAPTILAQTTSQGHALADPSADGSSVYWAETWRDAAGSHNRLWARDAAGSVRQLSLSAAAFAPHVVHGTLIWVDGQRGTLEARALSGGQHQWIVAQSVDSASVRVAGETVLWRAGGTLHTWDARTHSSSAVDAQVRTAAWVEASDSSIVWAGPGGSINIYDVD